MRRDALVSPLRLHNLRVPRGAILVFFAGLLEAAAAHTSFAPSPLLFLQKFASSRTETRHVAKLLSLRGAGEMSGDGPINTIAGTDALEWDDRISLQGKWTNAEKGWKVSVEWKQTPYGAGVFAAEDIPAGTVLRVGRNGLNQLHFRGVEDVEAFCRAGSDRSGTSDDAAYRSRLGYTKDYLYGFFPDTDERGYIDGSAREPDFVSMWIPGNGLNHNLEPNTVYRPAEGVQRKGSTWNRCAQSSVEKNWLMTIAGTGKHRSGRWSGPGDMLLRSTLRNVTTLCSQRNKEIWHTLSKN